MGGSRWRRWRAWLALAVLVPVLLVGGLAFHLADEAGALPWQEDPTAIPVVPFQKLNGTSPAAPTPTPAPSNFSY